MINKLKIENFQSHRETELEFHPGVNVIVGSSDMGKSAVIRALYWACNNKPSGDGFRSHWEGDTAVRVTFPDGWVERSKSGKTKNQYRLETKGNEVEVFNSFNQTVPDEIVQLINMDDLNWHLQMSTPFLLSARAGEVAKYLNSIVNLDVIDRTVGNINKRLRQVQQDARAREQQLREYEEELLSPEFALIPELERDLAAVKCLQEKHGELDTDVKDFASIITDIEKHQAELDALPDIDVEKATQEIATVHNLLKQDRELEQSAVVLRCTIAGIEEQEAMIEALASDIEQAEAEYMSQIGDRCPLCDQEIK